MVGDLTNNNDQIEQLGDMVEKELSSMDKAIEEVSSVESFKVSFDYLILILGCSKNR